MKARTLPALRPSAAIDAWFQAQLDKLLAEMSKSVTWWLSMAYRAKPPEALAEDAAPKAINMKGSPSVVMQRMMARLSRRWQRRFDNMAPELAKHFTTKIADRNDAVLKRALSKGGMSVKMQMTPQLNDVLQASMAQQVTLIKDLGTQYLSDISGMVQRSVAKGGDLQELSDGLQARYGITARRAALIARDQNSKATSTLGRARQESLGITEGIWVHSHAGKVPRPSHVKMSGKKFNLKEGMWDEDEGEYVMPGFLINCRCFWRPVLPSLAPTTGAAQ